MQAETLPTDHAPGKEERQLAMLCHLSAMLLYVTAIGGFIVPLVIWLLKRDEMPFVNDQGRETLNFQITVMIALVAAGILMLVLIGFVLVPLVLLFHFVLTIVAAIKTSEGITYRYPLCWRVIR